MERARSHETRGVLSRARTAGVGALFLAWLSAVAAEDPRVWFISPRNLEIVLGESTIELEVGVPPGARVEHVRVEVDGKVLTRLEEPPWRVRWDAGDARTGHRLEAVLVLSDGTETRSLVRTSPMRYDFVEEVALVNLYAVVRDGGSYVTGLKREDFVLTENGRRETIDRFSTEKKPLSVSIVLDSSLTMEGNKIEKSKAAALRFLSALDESDRAMVVSFSDEVRVIQEPVSSREPLARAIETVEAEGGTALYDAVYRTSRHLSDLKGRKVMIVLSDGRDEAASGLQPGSLHTLEEAIDRALRDDVMVFAIGFGKNLDETDLFGRRSHRSILREMAKTTGGRALFPSRAGQLRKAFEEVADDLRNHYSIAYSSDDERRDGSWRRIELTTVHPDHRVITRRGYYAPSEPVGQTLARPATGGGAVGDPPSAP